MGHATRNRERTDRGEVEDRATGSDRRKEDTHASHSFHHGLVTLMYVSPKILLFIWDRWKGTHEADTKLQHAKQGRQNTKVDTDDVRPCGQLLEQSNHVLVLRQRNLEAAPLFDSEMDMTSIM
jgi:hypothetical protein